MKKSYHTYSKKGLSFYQKLGIIVVIFFALICVALIMDTTTKDSNEEYTNEQLLHDHDGDGIPDHD